MNLKQENEIIAEDEINLYEYWKIMVKRKKILLGIFLVPVIIAVIIAAIIPRYYRGEGEITNPLIPAQNIVGLVGNIDDAKKNIIFTNNSAAIKSVLVSLPKKATDKVSVIIDAKTADIMPQAFKDIFDYISNLPEVKYEIERINAETDLKIPILDFKIKKLIEARKANLVFLSQITEMIKRRQLSIVNINPADLIEKDGDISLEIKNLEQTKSDAIKKKELLDVKVSAGILAPPSITKQPSNEKIKQSIIITVILSLMAGIFVVFFLNYIERMKMRDNK